MRNTSKIIDLTGQKFNKLTVLGIASRNPLYWECVCECGNKVNVRTSNLKGNQVKSCGCLHKRGNPKHNLSNTRIYRIYKKMIRRCYSEDEPAYKNYGGRGITVCDEWKNSVACFYNWSIENGYSDNLTIDRIDNNGNYTPDNCRWTTYQEQNLNRRSNIQVTINGETKTLSEWCEYYCIPYKRVHMRIRSGWDVIEAITRGEDARLTPKKRGNEYGK